jgi:hypothetical protein
MTGQSISQELLTAILAMDSYNRGGAAGIEVSNTQIGSATLLVRPTGISITDWNSAGFYATAYDTSFGTVISYRGTDNPTLFANANGPSDIIKGWVAGFVGALSGTDAQLYDHMPFGLAAAFQYAYDHPLDALNPTRWNDILSLSQITSSYTNDEILELARRPSVALISVTVHLIP